MVALPLIAIKGVHWARDGPKFSCKVDGCDASYTTKYNLIWHLWAHRNVTMESGKLGCPSIRKEGPRRQDHMTINAWVLSNPLAWFRHNDQKAIAKAKRHANLKWNRIQVYLQYTPKVPKPTLVKLTFSHILQLLGTIAWGVGGILLNVQAKLKHDEDLALVIQTTQARYAKAIKGIWMEHD